MARFRLLKSKYRGETVHAMPCLVMDIGFWWIDAPVQEDPSFHRWNCEELEPLDDDARRLHTALKLARSG